MGRNNQKIRKPTSIITTWKTIFILLFIVHVLFYAASNVWFREIISGSAGAEATFLYFSLGTALAIIYTLVVFIYIKKRHPQGKTKVISYIALIFLSLRMAADIFFLLWMVIGAILWSFHF